MGRLDKRANLTTVNISTVETVSRFRLDWAFPALRRRTSIARGRKSISPRSPFLMGKNVLLAIFNIAIFEVDVHDVGMPSKVGLGTRSKHGLERMGEAETFN